MSVSGITNLVDTCVCTWPTIPQKTCSPLNRGLKLQPCESQIGKRSVFITQGKKSPWGSRCKTQAFNILQQITNERIMTWKTPGQTPCWHHSIRASGDRPAADVSHFVSWTWRVYFPSHPSSYLNSLSLIDGCPKDAEWRNLSLTELGTSLYKNKRSPVWKWQRDFFKLLPKKGKKKKRTIKEK